MTNNNKYKILVIEDEEIINNLIKALIVLTFTMLLGRLEILHVFILFIPRTRKRI